VIEIDGPLWFAGALLICGAHVLYLRSWRREQRQYTSWWKKYDADAQKRHVEFMSAIDRRDDSSIGWNLSSNGQRGQA
jgi:hypothetical protein